MIEIFKVLEVREYHAKEILIRELDTFEEIFFVMDGRYDIGYEINKVLKLRIQYGARTNIGGFNICFDQRANFTYKANTKIEGLAIKRQHWKRILNTNLHFKENIEMMLLQTYDMKIRRPLNVKRDRELREMHQNTGLSEVIVLENTGTQNVELK